jgi:hypothetical protein
MTERRSALSPVLKVEGEPWVDGLSFLTTSLQMGEPKIGTWELLSARREIIARGLADSREMAQADDLAAALPHANEPSSEAVVARSSRPQKPGNLPPPDSISYGR